MKSNIYFIFILLPFTFFAQSNDFTCEYAANGKRIKCTLAHTGKNVWDTDVYYYDSLNRVIKVRSYAHSAEEDTVPGEIVYLYDGKGRLIKKGDYEYSYTNFNALAKMTYSNGKLFRDCTFSYDEKKRLVKGRFNSIDGGYQELYYSTRFPQQGLLKKDTLTLELKDNFFGIRYDSLLGYDVKGKLIYSEYRQYDSKGNRIERIEWGSSDSEPDKEMVYQEDYDKTGRYLGGAVIYRKRNKGEVIWTKKTDAKGKVLSDTRPGASK